jgi:hypothetical protein
MDAGGRAVGTVVLRNVLPNGVDSTIIGGVRHRRMM